MKPRSFRLFFAVVLLSGPDMQAATTGFNQSAAGSYDYNTVGNWVGSTINGTWDTSLTLAGAQTATFAADTALTSGLTFNYAGNFALLLDASAAGTKTLTLGGDINVNTGGGTTANVTIGNASNHLNVDLGTGGRMTVAASRILTLVDVVSNGGIIKAGAGTLTLSGANTYAGGTLLSLGTLKLGNASALGSGTLTISGGSLDSSASLVNSQNNPQSWNGDFSFTGTQNLNLGTGAVTLSATRQVTVTGNTLTVGGIISGSGFGLTKAGAGALALTGLNTYTGPNTISAGTLSVGNVDNLGAPAAGLVLDGGTLQVTGTTLTSLSGIGHTVSLTAAKTVTLDTNNAANTFTADQVLNQTTGGLTKLGAGTLVLNQANTYTGMTTISAGTLSINSIANAGVSSPLGAYPVAGFGGITLGASTLKYTGGTATTNRGFNLTGVGTIDVNSASTGIALTFGAVTLGSTLNVTGGTGSSLSLGAVSLTAASTLNPTSANMTVASVAATNTNLILSGTATGNSVTGAINTYAGTLTKSGTGTWTLNGANSFTGTTTVSTGILKLGHFAALQNSAYVTTGSTGAIGLDVTGYATPIFGGLSGAVNLATAITGYSGITGLTLNPQGSSSNSYTGIIANGSGAMALAKFGGGTQILSGANTYTGATTVNAGLLRINSPGSLSASSAVGVTGGAIGGNSTINGNVTLSGTGAVDLRDAAVGTLTLGGDLAINGAAGANRLYFDLGAAGAGTDKITVAGNTSMTTSGAGVITLNQIGGSATPINAGTYTLIQGTGTLPALGDFTLATTRAYGQTFSLGVSGNNLQVTAVVGTAGSAATTWSGTSSASWVTAGNWSSGAPGYTSVVTFSGGSNLSTTLDGNVDIKGLIYATTATTATTIAAGTGGMLTIEGSGLTVNTPTTGTVTHTISANVGIAANQTWTVNPSATLTVSGNVTDFGGGYTLTKTGSGLLNLNGATMVGSLVVGTTITGGSIGVGNSGSLSVGSGGSADNLYVGSIISGSTAAVTAILDVSAASSFTANVAGLYVGTCLGNATGIGTLNLGANNSITATKIIMGGNEPDSDNSSNHSATVTSAAGGTTTILTPYMALGTSKGTGTFTLGTNATLNLGSASVRTALIISRSDTSNGYDRPAMGTMNLSGGVANLYLGSLVIGRKTVGGNSNGVNTSIGTLTLGSSALNHLDVSGAGSGVVIGYTSVAGYAGTGSLTIGNLDATSSVTSTDHATAIQLGVGANGNGTLNLNGGTLTLTTTGSAIAGGGGTANLVLGNTTGSGTGMTLKAGASSTAWITGLTSVKIKATGVTFDSNGYDIALGQALLTDAVSTGGGLSKAGSGSLTLSGANTYTGVTMVSNGTLALGTTASLSSSGVEVAAGAVFHTVAQASYAIPASKPLTLHVSGTGSGSAGKITAGVLDISNATVVLTPDNTLNDMVYVLADYTSLIGGSFLSVTSVPGYTIHYDYNGNTQIALVSDTPLGYAAWAQTHITAIDLTADASIGGDPDGDGSSNLCEFAFGGNPLNAASNTKIFSLISPTSRGLGKELVLTVAVIATTTPAFSAEDSPVAVNATEGITYTVQGSGNLGFPNVKAVPVDPITTDAMNSVLPVGYEYRSFALDGSANLPNHGFLRAVVVKPD